MALRGYLGNRISSEQLKKYSIYSKDSHKPLSKVRLPNSRLSWNLLLPRRDSVQNSCRELNEYPTNGLVKDTRSRMDMVSIRGYTYVLLHKEELKYLSTIYSTEEMTIFRWLLNILIILQILTIWERPYRSFSNRQHIKFVEHLQSFISESLASRLILVFTNTKIKTNRSTIVLVV